MRFAAAILLILTGIGVMSSTASAHFGEWHSEDCTNVSAGFLNFPEGENVITVTSSAAAGNKTTRTIATQGSIIAEWTEIGVDTSKGGSYTVNYSWTADGGSSYGPFTFNADGCKPKYNPEIIVENVMCVNNVATISGKTKGLPEGGVIDITAFQADNPFGSTRDVPRNGPFQVSADITEANVREDGTIVFDIYATDSEGLQVGPALAVVQNPDDCNPQHGEAPTVSAQLVCKSLYGVPTFSLTITVTGSFTTVTLDGAAIELTEGTFTAGKSVNLEHIVVVTYVDGDFGPASVTTKVAPVEDCTPVKTNVDFTAKVVCSVSNGTAKYTLAVTKISGPDATFSPANGTVLSSGASVNVTATWQDANFGPLTKSVATTAVSSCVPSKQLPATGLFTARELMIASALVLSGAVLCLPTFLSRRRRKMILG